MDLRTNKRIDDLIESDYSVQIGGYISKAWKLLTANAGTFIVFVLVTMLISSVVQKMPVIGLAFSSIVLTPAFAAGYWYLAREADQEGFASLNTGFRGFNDLGKIIPVVLLKGAMILASLIPFFLVVGTSLFYWYQEVQSNPAAIVSGNLAFPAIGAFGFLLMLPAVYLAVAYSFALPLVLFRDMAPWTAMEASRKIVSKKWFAIFGLMFIAGFISGLGVILIVVGILFTASMSSLAMYSAYDDIIGFDADEDEEDEFDHLIA